MNCKICDNLIIIKKDDIEHYFCKHIGTLSGWTKMYFKDDKIIYPNELEDIDCCNRYISEDQ